MSELPSRQNSTTQPNCEAANARLACPDRCGTGRAVRVFQSQSGDISAATVGLTPLALLQLLAALYFAAHRRPSGAIAERPLATHQLALLHWRPWPLAAWWMRPRQPSGTPSPAEAGQHCRSRHRPAPAPVSVLIRRISDGKFVAQGQHQRRRDSTPVRYRRKRGHAQTQRRRKGRHRCRKRLRSQHPSKRPMARSTRHRCACGPSPSGCCELDDVEALVAKPGSLNENLLGMSFLRRLASYDLNGDFLTLRE